MHCNTLLMAAMMTDLKAVLIAATMPALAAMLVLTFLSSFATGIVHVLYPMANILTLYFYFVLFFLL